MCRVIRVNGWPLGPRSHRLRVNSMKEIPVKQLNRTEVQFVSVIRSSSPVTHTETSSAQLGNQEGSVYCLFL